MIVEWQMKFELGRFENEIWPVDACMKSVPIDIGRPVLEEKAHSAGCMVCGDPLVCLDSESWLACHYCGRVMAASACCEKNHHVCDHCYKDYSSGVIEALCLESTETDMLEMLKRLRRHPIIRVNGTEHHSLVPGIIIAAYRNNGGSVDSDLISTAVQRGSSIMGGSCAYTGICGSASGVGIAFSLLLQADPYKAKERQTIQLLMRQVMGAVSNYQAPRCCQRESWLSLKKAAELSLEYLPIELTADAVIGCQQLHLNEECIGRECPILKEKIGAKKNVTGNSR
jgi:Family of unknown function (DUF5714)